MKAAGYSAASQTAKPLTPMVVFFVTKM